MMLYQYICMKSLKNDETKMLQFQQRIFKYIELKEYPGFQHKHSNDAFNTESLVLAVVK